MRSYTGVSICISDQQDQQKMSVLESKLVMGSADARPLFSAPRRKVVKEVSREARDTAGEAPALP
ncbi:MAG: hypothetical protein DMF43_04770 [Verrucomicrobia bacterium]|nr:MAG: hypothetical protein DMF43_04770 [Verrucomicrobiota bacterium]